MGITHRTIIISMLYSLGGDRQDVDLETLSVSCFKTFPSKFSMDRFPEYPRFDRVQKRMSEIEKEGLVRKCRGVDYQLTEKGSEWIKNNPTVTNLIIKQKEKEGLNFQETLNYNIGEQEYEIEAKKLRKTETYRKYKAGEKAQISIMEFMTFMKVDIYAKKELFDRKVKRIKSICSRDQELKAIFDFLEGKYGLDYVSFNQEVKKMSKISRTGG